jgi:hypothetical protein
MLPISHTQLLLQLVEKIQKVPLEKENGQLQAHELVTIQEISERDGWHSALLDALLAAISCSPEGSDSSDKLLDVAAVAIRWAMDLQHQREMKQWKPTVGTQVMVRIPNRALPFIADVIDEFHVQLPLSKEIFPLDQVVVSRKMEEKPEISMESMEFQQILQKQLQNIQRSNQTKRK